MDVMKPGMSVLGRVVVDVREDAPLVARSLVRFDGQKYWLRAEGKGGAPVEINPVARSGGYYVLDDEKDGEALALLGIPAPGEREIQARAGQENPGGGTS